MPLAVKWRVLSIQSLHFCIADCDSGGVLASLQFGANAYACSGCRMRDSSDHAFVTHQRSTTPVLGHVTEQAMFNLVPCAGSWRDMAHRAGQPQARGYSPERRPEAPSPTYPCCAAFGIEKDARFILTA